MKNVAITDFLTPAEIEHAAKIVTTQAYPHKTLVSEIITPNMDRINKALGQENDPGYLAYAVEYAIGAGMQAYNAGHLDMSAMESGLTS
jgi:hypothetical protein